MTKTMDLFNLIDARLDRIENKIDELTVQVVENRTNLQNMKTVDMKAMALISTIVVGMFNLVKALVLGKP